MSRAQSYGSDVRRSTGGMAKDVETWLANSLATILAGAGIAGGVIGWFVAMGYVDRRFAESGTPVVLVVRGKDLAAKLAPLPFVPHRYFRGP